MNENETVRILQDAARLLRERGWMQGDYYENADGECCILGALSLAAYAEPDGHALHAVGPLADAEQALISATGEQYLFEWNDDPSRTADDVIGLLERTAAGLKAVAS